MVRLFSLLLSFFLFAPPIFAAVHAVPYNVRTVLDLSDGDTLSLTGFPVGWAYSRVVLGINSTPSVPMAGHLVVNNCKYALDSYYREIAFAFATEIKITYSGNPQQRMPIQWWVDDNRIFSKCEHAELTRADSIWKLVYKFADSLYEMRTAHYRDLGEMNAESIFAGSSRMFKISKLPEDMYNRIYVLIEPLDGKELNGFAYASNKKANIRGWTSTVVLSQKAKYAPYFEIAFPEYRKVKMKWWATKEEPVEIQIQASETSLGSDSVQANYAFGKTPYTSASVELKFDKNVFVDGQIPVIKKLSFNPHGPENLDEFTMIGDIFDIQAQLKSGQEVTLALPLDFNYVSGRDSVTVGHFIESENRWIEEPVDSIVGNYVFFRAKSFSLRSVFRKACKVVNTVATAAFVPAIGISAIFSEDVRDGIESFAAGWTDIQMGIVNGVVDGVYWLYDLYNELRCFDFDGVRDRFNRLFRNAESEHLDVPQGQLSDAILRDSLLLNSLKEKKVSILTTKKEAISHCALPDTTCNRQEYAWKVTAQNLDAVLADVILGMLNPDTSNKDSNSLFKRRFTFSRDSDEFYFQDATQPDSEKMNFTDYFLTNSGMLSDAAWVVRGLEGCYNATNITGATLTNWIEWGKSIRDLDYQDFCKRLVYTYGHNEGYLNDVIECGEFAVKWNSARTFFDSHIEKLQKISDAMTRISLLAWIDKGEFREYIKDAYKSVYDGIRAWLELAGPMLLENNLVAKAYASIALYEFIFYGTHENLDYLNSALKMHYGEHGGYSEGTGYSQYIWDDVPYILAALQEAYRSVNKTMPATENKFLKSPYYMIEFSRPVSSYGYIPVEIDDGCTYNPDYRAWTKLTGDANFLAWSEAYPLKPEDGKINPLVAFGFPDESLYQLKPAELPSKSGVRSSCKDGICLITVFGVEDTVALSMIAENGKMWNRGQVHDQQDNLSITLSSSKKGFLIQDRGYSGFGKRNKDDDFHHHINHNVLTLASNCDKNAPNESCLAVGAQSDNRIIGANEVRQRIEEFSGEVPGVFWSLLSFLVTHFDLLGDDFNVEGGSDAFIVDSLPNAGMEAKGYTAKHFLTKFDKLAMPSTVENHRSILYFGGNFWVIDRPGEQGMAWLANSPQKYWVDMGIHLYGVAQEDLGIGSQSVVRNVQQNSSRADYLGQDKVLLNNWFVIQDYQAKTYVMNYPINGEIFSKKTSRCPMDFQCFENTEKNKRLIVPPQGVKYKASSVLENFSGFPELDGIMLATRNKTNVWEYEVLDGQTFGEYRHGRSVDLPALRILLLR